MTSDLTTPRTLTTTPDYAGMIEVLLAGKAHVADRVYVFPRIPKGDHLGKDLPITPDGLYKQFEADFAPMTPDGH